MTAELVMVEVERRRRDDGGLELVPDSILMLFARAVRETKSMADAHEAGDDGTKLAMAQSFACGVRLAEMIARDDLKGRTTLPDPGSFAPAPRSSKTLP